MTSTGLPHPAVLRRLSIQHFLNGSQFLNNNEIEIEIEIQNSTILSLTPTPLNLNLDFFKDIFFIL